MRLLDPTTIRLHRTGSGPTIVLLHGLGATHRMWNGFSTLAGEFELISYDLPEHGETAAPDQPFEIEDLSGQLTDLLTASAIARAHVVGSSLGGMIAQSFAAAHPECVDRLVLCDTSPALSDGMREELLTTPDHALSRGAMARADLLDVAEEIFAPTLVLCANGADLAMREGADFLARSIPRGQLAFVPGAVANAVKERPSWVIQVLRDFLA